MDRELSAEEVVQQVVTHRTPNVIELLGPGPWNADHPKLKQLMAFARDQAANPDPLIDYFHTPDNLPPVWQAFFARILEYGEKACAANPRERIAWEKRGWIVEDAGLSEFDMLVSAIDLKEKGNIEFRNARLIRAFELYSASIRAMPLPDAMLNLAQVALKIHRYPLAEELCTKAFDTSLMTGTKNKTKAYLRRARARRYQGKVSGAVEDIHVAAALTQDDPDVQADVVECERVATLSEAKLKAYLSGLPKPPAAMTWNQESGLGKTVNGKNVDLDYIKVPASVDIRKTSPPTF